MVVSSSDVYFSHPLPGMIAAAIVIGILALLQMNRVSVGGTVKRGTVNGGTVKGGTVKACFVLGAILLAAAAAGVIWNRPAPPSIVVMVDLSPSTRGAGFRSRGRT